MPNGLEFFIDPTEDVGVDIDEPSLPPLEDFAIPFFPQPFLGDPSFSPAPIRADLPPGGVGGRLNPLQLLAALLGVGTLGAGIAGAVQGGGGQVTQQGRLSPQQQALFNQLTGGLQQQLPIQQALFGQGANLLQSLLAGGQIPRGLSQTVEQAFQPHLQDLFAQATEAGRQRGFKDAPATSPPGGAILGPGLAALQGQQAQAKLNLLPYLIDSLMRPGQQGIANLQTAFGGLPASQVTRQQPSLLQTLSGLGPVFQGAGQVFGSIPALANMPSFFFS